MFKKFLGNFRFRANNMITGNWNALYLMAADMDITHKPKMNGIWSLKSSMTFTCNLVIIIMAKKFKDRFLWTFLPACMVFATIKSFGYNWSETTWSCRVHCSVHELATLDMQSKWLIWAWLHTSMHALIGIKHPMMHEHCMPSSRHGQGKRQRNGE